MIHYRTGHKQDASVIAEMHASSWSVHYRGIFSDSYLDTDVWADRKNVWAKRFAQPDENQHVIIAEYEDHPIGFACTFLNHHIEWGALVDNLHVRPDWQGKGIGRGNDEAFCTMVTRTRSK